MLIQSNYKHFFRCSGIENKVNDHPRHLITLSPMRQALCIPPGNYTDLPISTNPFTIS